MTTRQMELTDQPAQPAAVVRGHVSVDELPAFLGGAFEEVLGVLAAQGREPAGPPFGRYTPAGGGFDAEVGFPSSGAVTGAGRVQATELPGGRTATALHVGGYETIGETYEQLAAWTTSRGCTPVGTPWESYLDGPEVAEPRTLVHLPCEETT
jgi:effector-binding domain-containing protein